MRVQDGHTPKNTHTHTHTHTHTFPSKVKWSAPGACKPEEGWYGQSKYCYEKVIHVVTIKLACSKRSISEERCEVKKAMKTRGGLTSPPPRLYFFALLGYDQICSSLWTSRFFSP